MKKQSKNKAKTYKIERISSEIERIVQEVVAYEINDPRVNGNATVTGIELTHDLSYCKVFVQIDAKDKNDVMDGLKNASGFVRHIIADTLDMRKTPDIGFVIDDSKDRMDRIEELIKQLHK